jgi:cobalamin biosynthesis Mg chelatase CobN
MKYLQVLSEKNLTENDLSKSLKIQMNKLFELIDKVQVLKETKGEQDEEFLKFNSVLEEMDDFVSKKIKKFNPEAYKKRLETLNITPAPYKVEPAVTQPSPSEPIVNQAATPANEVQQNSQSEAVVIEMNIPQPSTEEFSPVNEQVVNVESQEVVEEEFQKKGKGKMSTVGIATVLIAVGAVLVVAGSILYWKNHRKN